MNSLFYDAQRNITTLQFNRFKFPRIFQGWAASTFILLPLSWNVRRDTKDSGETLAIATLVSSINVCRASVPQSEQ